MNAHEFYTAFVRTAQESTLVTKEMLPSFLEVWGTATFLDLYRNNELAYTELVNKYIVHKIIKDAGMTAQHEYFRIDTVGWVTRYQEMEDEAHKLDLSAHLWDLKIAVEHENSKHDWTDEVIKLIHVKCPLKVWSSAITTVMSAIRPSGKSSISSPTGCRRSRLLRKAAMRNICSSSETALIRKRKPTTIPLIIGGICITGRRSALTGYRKHKGMQL